MIRLSLRDWTHYSHRLKSLRKICPDNNHECLKVAESRRGSPYEETPPSEPDEAPRITGTAPGMSHYPSRVLGYSDPISGLFAQKTPPRGRGF